MISRKAMLAGAWLLCAAPIAAQQAAPAATRVDPRKSQVLMFEDGLRRAVEIGEQGLAKEALRVAPVTLTFDGTPVVRGLPVTNYGYMFDVQVPAVEAAGVMLIESIERAGPPMPRTGSAQSVANTSGTVMSSGDAPADPVKGSAQGGVRKPFDARNSYRTNVTAALMDALLDNSGVLTLGDNETLLVTANGGDQVTSYRNSTSRLILTIKGADLNALRQGKITRDEAKRRIVAEPF